MLREFSFLSKFVFPHENRKKVGANELNKRTCARDPGSYNVVVNDAIMQKPIHLKVCFDLSVMKYVFSIN